MFVHECCKEVPLGVKQRRPKLIGDAVTATLELGVHQDWAWKENLCQW